MRLSKRSLVVAAVTTGVVVLAVAAGVWWQAGGRQRAIIAALPDPPAAVGGSVELQTRLAGVEQRARSRFNGQEALGELGRVYHANGFYEEAIRCYSALEQREPAEPKWAYWHAAILAGYGDIEPAIALLKRVVELAPDYRPAWLRLGDCELKSNRLDRAAAAYERVLSLAPADPYALLGLARIDLEAGRDDAARTKLETVLQSTNFQLGYDLIVSLYERAGMMERAAQIRGAAKASGAYRDPADPWLDAIIEDCYDSYRLSVEAGARARRGEGETALRLLRRAIELAPRDVSPLFQLAALLQQQGDLRAAREKFEQCTVLAPDFSDPWAHLSALCAQMNDEAGAARALSTGLRNCPSSPGLHLMAARKFRESGRTDDAVNEFLISIRLRPEEPDAYVELANTLIAANRTEEGVAELKRALVAEPGHPAALGTLAFYSIVSHQEREAREWLAQIARQPRVSAGVVARLKSAYREQFGREWVQ